MPGITCLPPHLTAGKTLGFLLAELQREHGYTEIGIGTPTADGVPIRICGADGEDYTFLVADCVNPNTGVTTTRVEPFE